MAKKAKVEEVAAEQAEVVGSGPISDPVAFITGEIGPETFIPAVEEPVQADPVAEPVAEPEGTEKPEAFFVFNGPVAERWLHDGIERLRGVFESVRYETEGVPEDHIFTCMIFAVQSVVPGGVCFVPKELAASEYVAEYKQVKASGGFVGLVIP